MNEFKLRTSGVGNDPSQQLPKLAIVKDPIRLLCTTALP